jgi:putative ABC transport system permease protein
MALSGDGGPTVARGTLATARLFDTLGTRPALGRLFQASDGTPGGPDVVVLGDALWRGRFGADPAIAGKTLLVDGKPFEIIGVLPKGFAFPEARRSELYPILKLEPSPVRAPFYLHTVARLRPGTGEAALAADLDRMTHLIKERYPDSPRDWKLASTALKETLVGPLRPALLLLLGAVSLVLLIAAANIAGLLLARAAGRRREMAVRSAMGASRARLARLLLGEALVLALFGGGLGVLLSLWGTDLFVAWSPRTLPRLEEVRLDAAVLWYTLGVTLAVGLLAGLAPALHGGPADLARALRESGRTTGDARSVRLRRLMVLGEFGLAVMLLGGAGLLLHSFVKLQRVDPGCATERILGARISLPQARYPDGPKRTAFFRDLVARSSGIPGVQSAAVSMALPPDRLQMTNPYTVEGHPAAAGQTPPLAAQLMITPDYFRTLGIPVLRGRDFTAADSQGAPGVVVIDQAMAHREFPGQDPVGRRMILGDPGPNPDGPWLTIVGVVGEVRYDGLENEPQPTVYTPYAQDDWWPSMYLSLRASGDPATVAASVRRVVSALDAELPVASVQTMREMMGQAVAEPRFRTGLVGGFAAAAVLLAALGAYALLSYAVRQRTREMGIRMALGARRADVMRLVFGEGMRLAVGGAALGTAGLLLLGRALGGLLYGVGPADLGTHAAVIATILLTAMLACWLPARRATRVEPTVALRDE